jgi:hypothetical protein
MSNPSYTSDIFNPLYVVKVAGCWDNKTEPKDPGLEALDLCSF